LTGLGEGGSDGLVDLHLPLQTLVLLGHERLTLREGRLLREHKPLGVLGAGRKGLLTRRALGLLPRASLGALTFERAGGVAEGPEGLRHRPLIAGRRLGSLVDEGCCAFNASPAGRRLLVDSLLGGFRAASSVPEETSECV
jgi:hypothetical protein